jgi:hypothetical protein
MTRLTIAAVGALLLLSLTACSGGPVADPTQPESRRPPVLTTTPGPVTTPGTPAEVSEARWDAIVADLRSRGVTGAPALVSAQAVTWSSGALGCPQPGRSYTQAMVEGMQVVVTASGRSFDYRFGRTDSPRLCQP